MKIAGPWEAAALSEVALCPQETSCIETEVEQPMQGMVSGRRVLVFNLRAHSSFGEGSTVTTFAAFPTSGSQLPAFQVRAKNILDRCHDTLQPNPVERDPEPDFARRFLLCCPDDTRKREFFTSDRLRHLRQFADRFQIRSSPDWLLIFRPGGVVSARSLRQFVQRTSTIALGLLDPELHTWLSR